MPDLLTGLNPIQQQAVLQKDGPILILAGAGSGKTRVLTHKIAHLIGEGVDPGAILAVTFTNKAAGEMKERLQHLLSNESKGNPSKVPSWTGTFHATCSKILRRNIHHLGFSNSFVIYDAGDQTDLIKEVMDELRIKPKEDKVNPNAVRATISSAKNEMVGPQEYRKFANGYFYQKVADIYPLYQAKLRANNALDFDDMLGLTLDLFATMPEVAQYYANLFHYIFIDEYQDTNKAQYMLIKRLAQGHGNLCVVGDMSQSIYSFRGATIQNILNFEKDYPNTSVFHLEQNYRSSQNILSAATHIILPNQRSHAILKLWTENDVGEPILLFEAEDEQDEAQYIAQRIKELVDRSVLTVDSNETVADQTPVVNRLQLSDIAILYRTNAQSRVLEEALLRHGLPYKLVGGTRFYDRREIKDVLSYLRLCVNAQDSVAFNRVANTPPRGIGPAALHNGGPKLDAFKQTLDIFNKASLELNVLELLDFILNHIGYKAFTRLRRSSA